MVLTGFVKFTGQN